MSLDDDTSAFRLLRKHKLVMLPLCPRKLRWSSDIRKDQATAAKRNGEAYVDDEPEEARLGDQVPYNNVGIVRAGGQESAIGVEAERRHASFVSIQRHDARARFHVPHTNHSVTVPARTKTVLKLTFFTSTNK